VQCYVSESGFGRRLYPVYTTARKIVRVGLYTGRQHISLTFVCHVYWQVFNVARNSCEQNLDSIVTDSEVAKFRRQEDVRNTVEALAKSAAGVNASPKRGTKGEGADAKEGGWFEYATSKQGAPRLLLFLGLTVLLVRVAWNVTKIRQMLRTIVFHGLVAVVLVLILFFLKSVFTEYFGGDGDAEVDTSAYSTIVPSRRSPGKPATTAKVAGAAKATAGGSSSTAVTPNKGAAAGTASGTSKAPSVNSNSSFASSTAVSTPAGLSGPSATSASGAHYGSISPLPPHVISSRNSADGASKSAAGLNGASNGTAGKKTVGSGTTAS
jgi:hypothetical protein